MAITKEKKEQIVGKVGEIAKDSTTIVFANFKGLSVAQQTEMRRALRGQGVGYTVAKKTLIKKALGGSAEGQMPEFRGEVALAYGKDELAPARELAVFVKKFPEQLAFAGGVFGGRFVDAPEMKAIAAIPPLQTLRGMFVNIINSPIQRFAVVLNEVAKTKGE
ncbi:MAG TPA: 50S ribosomal protein L10 [Candidatus Paceibacterota bacterium]